RLYQGVLVDNGLAPDSTPGRVYDVGGYGTLTPDTPAIVTFHAEADVRAMAATAGLLVDDVLHGTWSRVDGGPAFQDLVLLRAPSNADARPRAGFGRFAHRIASLPANATPAGVPALGVSNTATSSAPRGNTGRWGWAPSNTATSSAPRRNTGRCAA